MKKITIPLYGALLVFQLWTLGQAGARWADCLGAVLINAVVLGLLLVSQPRATR